MKVVMPRSSWDQVEMILEDYRDQGYPVDALLKEIQDQTHKQENRGMSTKVVYTRELTPT